VTTLDSTDLPVQRVRVAVIGGGPAGLTAAAELAEHVDGEVRVIEREDTPGGIPRHSDHPGYGVRDLHRFLSGPAYARRLTEHARDAGARLHTQAQVTGWAGDRRLLVTSPRGRHVVEADAVVLATGARERPRSARRIPGDRPDGVYTTGELQNLVHLQHAEVGRRAVVVGAELVSWSAVVTLREAGCRTVAMTSTFEHAEAYLAFRLVGRLALRTPVLPRTRVVRINGRERVQSVLLEQVDTGVRRLVPCDSVVTTGDWIPDHELARLGGLDLDRATLGPIVDTSLRTTATGVYAIGNLVHPVDTADGAALDGRHVGAGVRTQLAGLEPAPAELRISAAPPFRWVTPQRVAAGVAPPRGDLLLWCDRYHRFPVVRAVQDGRVLARKRIRWPAAPGRIFRVPADLVAGASAQGGPVVIELEAA
jgi:thioredoxin reductase